MVRLGDYIQKSFKGRTIDLLKIDVEGFACEVLLGLDEESWSHISNISIELEERKMSEIKAFYLSSTGSRLSLDIPMHSVTSSPNSTLFDPAKKSRRDTNGVVSFHLVAFYVDSLARYGSSGVTRG